MTGVPAKTHTLKILQQFSHLQKAAQEAMYIALRLGHMELAVKQAQVLAIPVRNTAEVMEGDRAAEVLPQALHLTGTALPEIPALLLLPAAGGAEMEMVAESAPEVSQEVLRAAEAAVHMARDPASAAPEKLF
jgi:hypothetical protein